MVPRLFVPRKQVVFLCQGVVYEYKKINKKNLKETMELVYKTTIDFKTSSIIKSDNDKKLFEEMFQEAFLEMELFGYFESDKLVGVIGLEDKNYIAILDVLENYQNKGIGLKLVKFIIDYIKETTEVLDVCSDINSVGFYLKQGFIQQEEEKSKIMMYYNIKK